ncbi:uncharacterized protein LOC100376010 [Saccoglossus kowalevskii]|uniref:Centromere protein C-like n=1 Tax=Saccoglossus kowalevskii TaxID=10224 RepID=A0ABM0GNG9_SACKO|nr:PREDICTED: centromere protein C-like [Saccoglossus kowalevskii]
MALQQESGIVRPFIRGNIGRRTGRPVLKKTPRVNSDGFDVFDDYWTDTSESDDDWSVMSYASHNGDNINRTLTLQKKTVTKKKRSSPLKAMPTFSPRSASTVGGSASVSNNNNPVQKENIIFPSSPANITGTILKVPSAHVESPNTTTTIVEKRRLTFSRVVTDDETEDNLPTCDAEQQGTEVETDEQVLTEDEDSMRCQESPAINQTDTNIHRTSISTAAESYSLALPPSPNKKRKSILKVANAPHDTPEESFLNLSLLKKVVSPVVAHKTLLEIDDESDASETHEFVILSDNESFEISNSRQSQQSTKSAVMNKSHNRKGEHKAVGDADINRDSKNNNRQTNQGNQIKKVVVREQYDENDDSDQEVVFTLKSKKPKKRGPKTKSTNRSTVHQNINNNSQDLSDMEVDVPTVHESSDSDYSENIAMDSPRQSNKRPLVNKSHNRKVQQEANDAASYVESRNKDRQTKQKKKLTRKQYDDDDDVSEHEVISQKSKKSGTRGSKTKRSTVDQIINNNSQDLSDMEVDVPTVHESSDSDYSENIAMDSPRQSNKRPLVNKSHNRKVQQEANDAASYVESRNKNRQTKQKKKLTRKQYHDDDVSEHEVVISQKSKKSGTRGSKTKRSTVDQNINNNSQDLSEPESEHDVQSMHENFMHESDYSENIAKYSPRRPIKGTSRNKSRNKKIRDDLQVDDTDSYSDSDSGNDNRQTKQRQKKQDAIGRRHYDEITFYDAPVASEKLKKQKRKGSKTKGPNKTNAHRNINNNIEETGEDVHSEIIALAATVLKESPMKKGTGVVAEKKRHYEAEKPSASSAAVKSKKKATTKGKAYKAKTSEKKKLNIYKDSTVDIENIEIVISSQNSSQSQRNATTSQKKGKIQNRQATPARKSNRTRIPPVEFWVLDNSQYQGTDLDESTSEKAKKNKQQPNLNEVHGKVQESNKDVKKAKKGLSNKEKVNESVLARKDEYVKNNSSTTRKKTSMVVKSSATPARKSNRSRIPPVEFWVLNESQGQDTVMKENTLPKEQQTPKEWPSEVQRSNKAANKAKKKPKQSRGKMNNVTELEKVENNTNTDRKKTEKKKSSVGEYSESSELYSSLLQEFDSVVNENEDSASSSGENTLVNTQNESLKRQRDQSASDNRDSDYEVMAKIQKVTKNATKSKNKQPKNKKASSRTKSKTNTKHPFSTHSVSETPAGKKIMKVEKQKIITACNNPTPGTRRSRRNRVPPTRFWMLEKPIYERRQSGGLALVDIQTPSTKIRVKRNNNIPKKGHSKKAVNKIPEYTSNVFHDVQLDGTYEEISDVMIPVIDTSTNSVINIDCVRPSFAIDYHGPTGEPACPDDSLIISKSIDEKDFSVGSLILRPLQSKPAQLVGQYTLAFIVKTGLLNVLIHETEFLVRTDDHFFVPPGNAYSLQNLKNEDAEIIFFLVKK